MTESIKMNYQVMEEASASYKEAAATSKEMIAEVQAIALMLEEGGLLGRAGSSLVDGMNNNLVAALTRISDKFDELNGNILGAMSDRQSADSN